MFTSISEYVAAKNAATKIATNESSTAITAPATVATTKIAEDSTSLKLESVIKKLNVCHFIITKGLINESSSLTSINEAIEGEFGVETFFETEEELNGFYATSMEETKNFLMEEGFLDKIASVVNKTTNKAFKLDDTLVASEKAKAFLADPKYKKTVELAKQALMSKFKVPQDKVESALTAMLNYTNGETPNFNNTTVTFDADKNEISFMSNSKGAGAKVF